MFAPVTVRTLEELERQDGCSTLVSMTTKRDEEGADRMSRPMVRVEPQPTSGPS